MFNIFSLNINRKAGVGKQPQSNVSPTMAATDKYNWSGPLKKVKSPIAGRKDPYRRSLNPTSLRYSNPINNITLLHILLLLYIILIVRGYAVIAHDLELSALVHQKCPIHSVEEHKTI